MPCSNTSHQSIVLVLLLADSVPSVILEMQPPFGDEGLGIRPGLVSYKLRRNELLEDTSRSINSIQGLIKKRLMA